MRFRWRASLSVFVIQVVAVSTTPDLYKYVITNYKSVIITGATWGTDWRDISVFSASCLQCLHWTLLLIKITKDLFYLTRNISFRNFFVDSRFSYL